MAKLPWGGKNICLAIMPPLACGELGLFIDRMGVELNLQTAWYYTVLPYLLYVQSTKLLFNRTRGHKTVWAS